MKKLTIKDLKVKSFVTNESSYERIINNGDLERATLSCLPETGECGGTTIEQGC